MKQSKKQLEGLPQWSTFAWFMLAPVLFVVAIYLHTVPGDDIERDTLYVTVITLVVVTIQVYLARLELETVSEDVERNRILFEKASREALLYLSTGTFSFTEVPSLEINGDYYYQGSFSFEVHNLGHRTASEFIISLGVPAPYEVSDNHWRYNGRSGANPNDSEPTYEFYSRQSSSSTVFPNTSFTHFIRLIYAHDANLINLPFYYRIIYEDGASPREDGFYSTMRLAPNVQEERRFEVSAPRN